MAQYILFDRLCEDGYANAFLSPAKTLLARLNIAYKSAKFKKDLGLKGKALDSLKFHTANATNLEIAAKEGCDILCVDDSSFLSLNLTKQALANDEKLQGKIKAAGIALAPNVNIVHLKALLAQQDFKAEIKKPFNAFYTAIYSGSNAARVAQFLPVGSTCKLVDALGAKIVKTATSKANDGYEIANLDKKIAYKLAGDILLDAFDNAADFLISNDVTSFCILEHDQCAISKIMGRDVNLNVFNIYQLLLLSLGETSPQKVGLDDLHVKVTLL